MRTGISLQAYYNNGIRYYENGKYDLAIECFKKAIKKDSLNHKFHYNLGLAYVKKEEYDLAISSFKDALSLNSEDIDIFYNLATAYSIKGEYNKAIQTYEKVLKLKPDDYNSYDGLGVAYFSLKDYDKSILNFKISLELDPQNSSVAYNLAYTYYVIEKYNQAHEYFLYVISLNDQDIEAYFNLGNVYIRQNRTELAIESFKKVLSLNPGYKEAANLLSALTKPIKKTLADDDPLESSFQEALRHVIKKQPEAALEKLKKILEIKSDFPKAVELFEKVSGLLNEADDLFNKGLYYFSNNNYLQAVNCFKNALLIKSADSKIKDMLYKAVEGRKALVEKQRMIYQQYIDKEQYETAVEVLKKAISEDPLEPENHFNLGKIYLKQNEYYNTVNCLRETLSLDPDHVEAKKVLVEVVQMINVYKNEAKDYFKLALRYTEKQDYTNALSVLGKILQLKSDNTEAKTLLVKVMALINETSANYSKKNIDNDVIQKIVEYKNQLKKNPNDYDAYVKLGTIYGQLQRYDAAINCFKKVLLINPDCEEAKQSLFALMKIINTR